MWEIDEALELLHREAAWLGQVTSLATAAQSPFTPSRAKKIATALAAVNKAQARYKRALREHDGPDR